MKMYLIPDIFSKNKTFCNKLYYIFLLKNKNVFCFNDVKKNYFFFLDFHWFLQQLIFFNSMIQKPIYENYFSMFDTKISDKNNVFDGFKCPFIFLKYTMYK